jgi:WD40 repeat protein
VILEHEAAVFSLMPFAADRLASGGDDGRIKLWLTAGGAEPTVLEHGAPVSSLALLPDGRLASGGLDGKVKLWPVTTEALVAALCLRAGRNPQGRVGALYRPRRALAAELPRRAKQLARLSGHD